jgi:RNA polymerase sigma-70 factor, ECF subfamily
MTNEELMLKYRDGDAEAFDMLFKSINHRIFGYVSKNLSDKNERDDVVQNIFIKLHTSKEKYNPAYPFDAWIFTISRSVLYDHLRKSSKIRYEELKDFLLPQEETEAIDLQSTLDKLNEKNKNVVMMKYMDELSFEEIAKKIETTPGNIRQIISRAIRLLRKGNEV